MIQIKKGLDLPIQGNPKNVISESPRVTSCGILGPDYIGMKKPTMLVKEGDQVLGGEAFEDKKSRKFFHFTHFRYCHCNK